MAKKEDGEHLDRMNILFSNLTIIYQLIQKLGTAKDCWDSAHGFIYQYSHYNENYQLDYKTFQGLVAQLVGAYSWFPQSALITCQLWANLPVPAGWKSHFESGVSFSRTRRHDLGEKTNFDLQIGSTVRLPLSHSISRYKMYKNKRSISLPLSPHVVELPMHQCWLSSRHHQFLASDIANKGTSVT